MELTEQQKNTVKAWVAEGCGLSEIQRRLASEFGLRPTFMDVRFLILDLGLEIKEAHAPKREEPDAETAADALADSAEGTAIGGVSVEVDRLVKPGAVVSGNVTFSDGVTAAWMLDQTGRLALDASQEGYRPTPEDIEQFQQALQAEMAKKGF